MLVLAATARCWPGNPDRRRFRQRASRGGTASGRLPVPAETTGAQNRDCLESSFSVNRDDTDWQDRHGAWSLAYGITHKIRCRVFCTLDLRPLRARIPSGHLAVVLLFRGAQMGKIDIVGTTFLEWR